mgnify:FL=1
MARFEDVKVDVQAPGEIFQRLCEGDTLAKIAKEWRLPKGHFTRWFVETHVALFDAAAKVRADELVNEALAVADEQAEVVKKDGTTYDPDVPRDKLRVETRMRLAEKWDRARYGAQVKVEHSGGLVVDAGLLGTIGDLLRAAGRRESEKVVADISPGQVLEAVSPAVAPTAQAVVWAEPI